MTLPDDSTLDIHEVLAVEKRARALLDRAAAWGRLPIPIDDIIGAAQLKVAPRSVFDPVAIMEYLRKKTADATFMLKNAVTKILGVYDADDATIHIDHTVRESKQTFLKLHETGHHELPAHKKMFRFFQDCEKTLAPEISDQFEREANNFARCVLFQGPAFGMMAADHKFEIKTPIKLASKFGASVYAACREYARTNHRACVVYILEPIETVEGAGARALVRRIEPSPSFKAHFGRPTDQVIDLDHHLGHVLPIGRKMTRPRQVVLHDKNGDRHECLAEAFDSTFNVLILLWPQKSLEAPKLILPPGLSAVPNAF